MPNLINAIGGIKPLEATAARVAWFQQDILDWAELLGMPVSYHPQYPLRNSRALRACLYAADMGKPEAFVCRVLRAYWSEAGDITDLGKLAGWGDECGLDGEGVTAAARSEVYKSRIETNTEEAIARGVFGVPTVDAGAKLYFGNDRLELLDKHLSRG